MALLSDSIIGLQNQLNILYDVAKRLDLIVNLDKSNVVVFRNGGFLASTDKWYFGSTMLTAVNMYKYLGMILTSRMSFQQTFNDLSVRARKGVSAIIRMMWSIGEHSPKLFFKMFDCQIQPILTYGAEVWGLSQNQDVLERVHLCAMKRFMCLTQKAPRHLIYGELGRYPLKVITFTKCIKFWLRIVQMEESRIPKKAYNMLLFLQRQNYDTWACNVRNVLYMYGYGIVWEAQSVGSVNLFIRQFKQRLVDCYCQEWHTSIESHDFYQVYSAYGHSLSLRPYFTHVKNINIRKLLSRFRLGMLPLRDHFMQYKNMRRNQTPHCPFCCSSPETEIHFLLVCPKYADLRHELIPCKYFRQPNLFKMTLLLSSMNETLYVSVAKFIYRAFRRRDEELQ